MGNIVYGKGEHLVRTFPEEDYTIGFFVALFERSDSATKETKKKKK
jgi:16S rRNA C967 or C1407 C5-methylase (RsmB/RsmF family)